MITLALFTQIAEDGVAGLMPNRNFFWGEAPLQRNGQPAHGVWMVTRGGEVGRSPRKHNLKTTIDFYVAFAEKLRIEEVHGAIYDWIVKNRCICELTGAIEYGGKSYEWTFSNVRLRPTTTPQNDGMTENGLLVKVASTEVVYDDDK